MGTLDHRMQQVLRTTALHVAGGLPPVRRLVAAQLEETDLNYRRSPIVSGQNGRSGVRPGDSAPDVADSGLRERLVALGGGTTALVFGNDNADQGTALAGVTQIRVVSDQAAAGTERDVLVDPDGRISRRYGVRRGDVVLIRPDGYVGFVGSLTDTDAITRYRSAAGCAATGGMSSNVNDAPSLVAASASVGVS